MIKNSKEFILYYAGENPCAAQKKYLKTLFSAISRYHSYHGGTVEYLSDKILTKIKYTNVTLVGEYQIPSKYQKIVRFRYHPPSKLIFLNGYNIYLYPDNPFRVNWYKTRDGKYHTCNHLRTDINAWDSLGNVDIVDFGSNHGTKMHYNLYLQAVQEHKAVEKWAVDGYYYLFLEDFETCKRGDFIKSSAYEYSTLLAPVKVIEKLEWYSKDLSCNLSLNTIDEISQTTIKKLAGVSTCVRQEFGCSRGCIRYCMAESEKNNITSKANLFVELKKKYL